MRRTDVQPHSGQPITAPALEVSAVVSDKTAIVHIAGELDLATAPELETVLHGLERQCARIVLDLSHLSFIDSTGLRLAVIEHHRATMDGFDFAIAGATGPVLDVLRLTGLDITLPMAPDVATVLDTHGPSTKRDGHRAQHEAAGQSADNAGPTAPKTALNRA
jgi:anti-sigma B factor antagonist